MQNDWMATNVTRKYRLSKILQYVEKEKNTMDQKVKGSFMTFCVTYYESRKWKMYERKENDPNLHDHTQSTHRKTTVNSNQFRVT